jgi:beta-phosphoglucomutase-like phosphatase (HAD superfamily)
MKPGLVIFDCDGVLIDSEGVASAVVAADLSALGWEMTMAEAQELFLGMSITDMEPMIEARLGRRMGPVWRDGLAAKLVVALGEQARVVPGARAVLLGVTGLGLPWRVASNSSDEEMAVKFARTGLADLVAGRCHSAASVIALGGRPKPAPDVYLAAAAAQGVAPARCVVLEDSKVGVTGAVKAGMVCYGFARHGDAAGLLAAGAVRVLRTLDEFLHLLEGL